MLQVYKRRFPISVVKACCQVFYNKPLYNKTWKTWKDIVGIKLSSRIISYEEFLRLFELINNKKNYAIESKEELEELLLKAIGYLDAREVYKGFQLPKVLNEIYGMNVSFGELHEKISDFGLNKTYRLRDLLYLF